MGFLMNDLSIHGQFSTVQEFARSVDVLMAIRQAIRRAGSELFCHRELKDAQVTAALTMQRAIQAMSPEKRRAWMQWLTQLGPYWTDERRHTTDDWLELADGAIVTDNALGEAAYCRLHGLWREVVSFAPSQWLRCPIAVTWRQTDGVGESVNLLNHWTEVAITKSLLNLLKPYDSWKTLETHVRRACELLTFADDAFSPLAGQPYAPGAADRIQLRLNILNTMRGCFDKAHQRTREGDRLYADHFTGEKAWFSNSSDSEKRDFGSELTFAHPGQAGQYLFCTWHGKVKTPPIRIHFSWPIAADKPLYVVYVGPKITKR
jgi:hypothetical protein